MSGGMVWEIGLEIETFDQGAGENDQGAIALVLDLVEAFDGVSFSVVVACATHFDFSRKILRVLLWLLRAPEARSF